MKALRFVRCLLAGAVVSLAAAGFQAVAQTPAGPPPGMNAVLNKLLRNNAFSAKAELRVLDKQQKQTTWMPLQNYTMLDGKTRFEVDMGQVKSEDIAAQYAAFFKQMGNMVVIIRPDMKETLVAYPKMLAYTETTMSKEQEDEMQRNYRVDKTKTGKETIDGHACDKNQVVLTDDKGEKQNATVWTATDLKDFPLQIQLADQENTIIIKFKDVKLARPDAKQFEAPPGLAKLSSGQMAQKLAALAEKK